MRLLFVDDDRPVLDFLKVLLREMEDEWEMEFVESGEEALESLSRTPSDLIVADMEMPGMNGVELLAQVKERFPSTLRLVLSAHQNYEEVLRTVGSAHHFMTKPVDLNVLKKVVGEAIAPKTLQSLILPTHAFKELDPAACPEVSGEALYS